MSKVKRHPVLQDLIYRAQYVGLRMAAIGFQSFPINVNLITAKIIGQIWHRLLPRHRERAETHLRASYPEMSDREVKQLARESMVNLVQVAMEMLFTTRLISATTWQRYVRVKDLQTPLRLLLSGRPLIMLTGHYGSWELLGYTLACLGFEVNAVMRPLDNPYLNRWVEDVRARHGLVLMHKRGVSARAEDLLRRSTGRQGNVVAFIADQDAGRKGVFVDFFGRPASTYKSIGLLAMEYQAPIIVGYARRTCPDQFQYEIGVNRVIMPEEWQGRDNELHWITQEYSTALEQIVRQEPSQYLWMHRRWKHQPKETSKS